MPLIGRLLIAAGVFIVGFITGLLTKQEEKQEVDYQRKADEEGEKENVRKKG